jgi:SAM-dependent methyltransferase
MSLTDSAVKYSVPDEIELRSRECWCGSRESGPLYDRDRWGQPLRTVICEACGTIRLDPRMTRTGAEQYYASLYPERQRDPARFFREQEAQGASEYLKPYLSVNMRILDYGCGPGGKLARLARDGYSVYAYDLNPAYRDYAARHGLIPFDPDMKYDAVYLSHTVEHWTDPFEDLQRLVSRHVRDGGLVLIEAPLIDRLLLGGRRQGVRGDTYFPHVWYFSVSSLDSMLHQLKCTRIFTDRLTLCVYKYSENASVRSVSAMRARGRWLVRLIAVCAAIVNRFVRYVDVSQAGRLNPDGRPDSP